MHSLSGFSQSTLKTVLLSLTLFSSVIAALPRLTKIGETEVTDSAFDGNSPGVYQYLNAVVEQRDQLVSYKGWQYATFYQQMTGPTVRHLAIARRRLPAGVWESFDFGDYVQSTNDDHNGIALGICPNDGTIHLSFDHHVSPLHYRRSQTNVANNPSQYVWSASLFGAIGGNAPPNAGSQVTYPKFVSTPDGNLLFEFRDGGSGNGDDILYKYSGGSNSWIRMGMFINGKVRPCNAYPNGFQFDNNGRLHATWGWRETPDGTTEHDLMYAYSPDTGATWYTTGGLVAATTGVTFMTETSTPSTLVWPIPQNDGLWDSEGLGIDRNNCIHTLIAHDTLGGSKLFHYYRDNLGSWHCTYTGITHVDQVQRVVFDMDNNAYVALGRGPIAAASAPNWTDWKIIDSTESGRFLYCALVDGVLARDSCILSVLNQGTTGPNSKRMYVLNYRIGSGTSTVVKSVPTLRGAANVKVSHRICGGTGLGTRANTGNLFTVSGAAISPDNREVGNRLVISKGN